AARREYGMTTTKCVFTVLAMAMLFSSTVLMMAQESAGGTTDERLDRIEQKLDRILERLDANEGPGEPGRCGDDNSSRARQRDKKRHTATARRCDPRTLQGGRGRHRPCRAGTIERPCR